MPEKIEFPTRAGQPAQGEVAWPEGEGKTGAVVVLHEWWGLNDHVRAILARLAGAGFVALAPDLYHGRTTRDPAEAAGLMQTLKWADAMEEVGGALDYLKAHPRCHGGAAVLGFCMGGAGTFVASGLFPLEAAVVFYGLPPAAAWHPERVQGPVLAHFATRDRWALVARAEELRRDLQAHGKDLELHVYDAEHAFANDTRPEVYAPEAAALAWARTLTFLHAHLG